MFSSLRPHSFATYHTRACQDRLIVQTMRATSATNVCAQPSSVASPTLISHECDSIQPCASNVEVDRATPDPHKVTESAIPTQPRASRVGIKKQDHVVSPRMQVVILQERLRKMDREERQMSRRKARVAAWVLGDVVLEREQEASD